jgi:hypothetical protein
MSKETNQRIETEKFGRMSVGEMREFVGNSGRFHTILHTDAFMMMISRLDAAETRLEIIRKVIG